MPIFHGYTTTVVVEVPSGGGQARCVQVATPDIIMSISLFLHEFSSQVSTPSCTSIT